MPGRAGRNPQRPIRVNPRRGRLFYYNRIVEDARQRSEEGSPSTIFVSAAGRLYGSWIGSRTPDGGSGALIRKPEYQIESILRDGLGLVTANINTDKFDRVVDTQQNQSAFSWNSQGSGFGKCVELSTEFGFMFLTDHNNKITVTPIAQNLTHAVRFTANDLIDSNALKIRRTSSDLIANEIILRYGYNYVTNTYDNDVEVSTNFNTLTNNTRSGFRDGYSSYSTLMSGSRTKYNTTRRMEFEAIHTYEKASADYITKHLCDWRALQRYILELDCPFTKLDSNSNMTTADVEIGDLALVNHELLPLQTSNISGTTAISDNALFVVTNTFFDTSTLMFHFILRETPYGDIPTQSEMGTAETGYGARTGTDYGGGL